MTESGWTNTPGLFGLTAEDRVRLRRFSGLSSSISITSIFLFRIRGELLLAGLLATELELPTAVTKLSSLKGEPESTALLTAGLRGSVACCCAGSVLFWEGSGGCVTKDVEVFELVGAASDSFLGWRGSLGYESDASVLDTCLLEEGAAGAVFKPID